MKQEGYEAVRYKGCRGYRVVELKGEEIANEQYLKGRVTE